jgi:antagonist of KipI
VIVEVVDGGLQTTVQDAGRPDWTHLGVPVSGAADMDGLVNANALVGNDPHEPGLEITLLGPRLVVQEAGAIAIGGSDLGARVDGRPLAVGRALRVDAGQVITFEGARPDAGGIRAYVAIAGGIDVPVVLGSRSTCLPGGFGGFEGRALRTGDTIRSLRRATTSTATASKWAIPAGPDRDEGDAAGDANTAVARLRVVAGPSPGLEALVASEWQVSASGDRVGVRLDGPRLPGTIAGEDVTRGVPGGAVQVPPDGRPIILSADHQTTGGYRVPAVVIAADLGIVGQLGPGMGLRFEPISLAEADEAMRRKREAVMAAANARRETTRWDDLVASAGG